MNLSATVIIVTLNRPDHVRRCLQCQMAQTRTAEQIIVVDASPDDLTRKVVAEFAGVEYLRNENGFGRMTASRNIGLLKSRGEIIAFVDDDAFAHDPWLENLLSSYTEDAIGAVGGRVLGNHPENTTVPADQIGRLTRNGILTPNFWADPGSTIEVNHMMGCNMSFRRSVLGELGGFREMFAGISGVNEDSDMSLRVGRSGYKILFNPKAVVDHVGAPQVKGRRFDARYAYYAGRNHTLMIMKLFGLHSPKLWRLQCYSLPRMVGRAIKHPEQFRLLVTNVAGTAVGFVLGIWSLIRDGRSVVRHDPQGQAIRSALLGSASANRAGVRTTRLGGSGMSIVFINNALETFTPTQSGALATIIWECCRVAQRDGQEPLVISRRCAAEPFAWPKLKLLDYPRVPTGKLGVTLFRAERRVTGWRHLRHREWAHRVVRMIQRDGLSNRPMVLMNDPELAVLLRDAFPKARLIHWFQNQLPCKDKFRKAFAGAAAGVLGVSNFTSRWVEDYYQLKKGSVQTLYNAVDSEAFCPVATEPPGHPVINFVGRTGIEKAPDVVLKAANVLAKKHNRFAVQLIGSNHWDRFEMDDYQRQLQQLTGELESRGVTVRRPGHIGRSGLPAELRKAHIHVMPSRWDEPFGMTTVEGMATGLATIASRTGGTPEILDGHGILFDRDSVDQLAAAMEELVDRPDVRRAYAMKARQRAQEFNWGRVWSGLKTAAGI